MGTVRRTVPEVSEVPGCPERPARLTDGERAKSRGPQGEEQVRRSEVTGSSWRQGLKSDGDHRRGPGAE